MKLNFIIRGGWCLLATIIFASTACRLIRRVATLGGCYQANLNRLEQDVVFEDALMV